MQYFYISAHCQHDCLTQILCRNTTPIFLKIGNIGTNCKIQSSDTLSGIQVLNVKYKIPTHYSKKININNEDNTIHLLQIATYVSWHFTTRAAAVAAVQSSAAQANSQLISRSLILYTIKSIRCDRLASELKAKFTAYVPAAIGGIMQNKMYFTIISDDYT